MTTTYRDLFKLYDLIQCGDVRAVQRFVSECPVDVNSVLPGKGIGVLHLAVGVEPLEKSKACTEILLKHGADPNLCTDDHITPVHIAAIWGRVDNLKLLIGCGGDPSRRDLDGHSAFDYAAREQQWDVYDYFHNVVDRNDDSFGSDCAYTLELDKILVTTDELVAEYAPVTESELPPTPCRKSAMVRDWCDKTTLYMNKLYPTILGETYILDESEPWETFSETQALTDESKTSYKTCFSRKLSPKDIKISGINILEETADMTQDKSLNAKKRLTVYKDFSLPGSPNSISHTNYNTKTNLKKSKSKSPDLSSQLKSKLSFDDSQSQSLLTDDNSVQVNLDRAMILVQNKTNEWLSASKKDEVEKRKCGNTRRSSGSSGVSSAGRAKSSASVGSAGNAGSVGSAGRVGRKGSAGSAGGVAVARVTELRRYTDARENVTMMEKRLLVPAVIFPVEESDSSPDQTIISVASSLPPSVQYDNRALRAELVARGLTPGPVNDSTRTLYLKKLETLKKNPIVATVETGNVTKSYSIELHKSLQNDAWMKDLNLYIDLDTKSRADFAAPNKKWREGTSKTSFTYLLLDPRITDNLPARAAGQALPETWATFVKSIFYVGKGKRSRPYSHLYQALTLWNRKFTSSKDKKVQHILDVWAAGAGVVCLHVFQNVIPAEAYTNEAAMIDVIGVPNLKNIKTGNYYGVAASWPLKERRMLGQYLLYKAMMIFLSEGERQLRPDDID